MGRTKRGNRIKQWGTMGVKERDPNLIDTLCLVPSADKADRIVKCHAWSRYFHAAISASDSLPIRRVCTLLAVPYRDDH